MIVLTKGNNNETFVVTLTEKATVSLPTYIFTCTDTNNNVVTFTFTSDDDISTNQQRYNEFRIDTDAIFGNYPAGTYQYSVTEQESDTILEVGKLELKPTVENIYTAYENNTIYKGYGG